MVFEVHVSGVHRARVCAYHYGMFIVDYYLQYIMVSAVLLFVNIL